MNFEIYAYWNTVELAGVFNAIAALTGGSDFKGLLKTLSLVAVLAVVLAALGGKGKVEDFWRWVILLGIFNGMLLVPKATVQIVDRTGAAPTMVVANVPLGLASLAHGTSKIGDWLTTSYETVFSLPDEVQLRKNGTLFGHRVARERLLMTTTNPLITHNLVEFYRECVLPSIATGNFSAKDIFESSDIWTTLAAVNPGLMVQLVNPSTGVPYDPESCGDAYTKQTPHLTAEAENVAKEKGAAYYPNVSSALATTTFKNSLASTTSYLLNVSKTAPDLIKQAMVGNAIIDAGYKVAAQMGDPSTAQVKLAEAQSLRAFNVSYSTQANLATE
ncbi:MAG: conjugal transfer protein TraG N-terminal domain-containing protein, partial [Deltaproteobacteria bacterium]|nr:conjugal transfer protein TraG N-terminal domain-containing protein [Deltaproteobacteria bacterium]